MHCPFCPSSPTAIGSAKQHQVRIPTTPSQSSKRIYAEDSAEGGHYWTPMTAGPYLVPVSRWVE